MPPLPRTSLALILLATTQVSASVGVLDINDLLQPDLNSNLFTPTEDQPYAPWSYAPYCTTSTHLAHLGQKYCVYTSNTTGPHGLSLIFKPEDAQRATQYLNDIPLSSFLTQEQAETLYFNPAPWKVVDIPGKDKGVVATRKIKRYETFMLDQAALVIDMTVENAVPYKETNKMLKLAVDRLIAPSMVRDMSAKHNDLNEDDGEGTLEENVMKTNAFGSTVADISTRALFPLISRINHACNPNSFVMFSRAGVSMAIKAYRDIDEGEEISISYLLLGIPSAKRAELLTRWGFTCTCSLCSLAGQEKKASDLRRVMIAQAEEKIISLAESRQIDQAIELAEEVVDMIIDEDIHPMLTDEYSMLAMLYMEKGDTEKAEEYGRKAWRLLADLGFLGVGNEQPSFSLERLLGGIGGLGGDGEGSKWRRREG